MPKGAHPSSVTVSKDRAERYFVSFALEEIVEALPPIEQEVGIDLGLTSLVALSTGEVIGNPKFFATEADWDHSNAQFNDPNLVVSPINSRNDFTTLINSARSTLLIEAEEMNDSDIEQAIANAAQHGVQVEVILPAASTSSGDSNSQGIATIKQSVKRHSKTIGEYRKTYNRVYFLA